MYPGGKYNLSKCIHIITTSDTYNMTLGIPNVIMHDHRSMFPFEPFLKSSAGEFAACLTHGEEAQRAATSSAVTLNTSILLGNTFVCVSLCAHMLTCVCLLRPEVDIRRLPLF